MTASGPAPAPDAGTRLRLQGVSKSFGGVQALDQVDFEVRPGEVHCLAGENGSGKSTLIKIVSGVHAPEPGARIRLGEQEHHSLDPGLARRLGVQVIWQDLALFPELSVAENIAFEHNLGPPRLVGARAIRDTAERALAKLGFEIDLERSVGELPISERQIVAICRALVADARIVFMDEPTASLTQAETHALFDVVRRLSGDGISVVFVSHRLAEVLEISERVTVLRDGQLVGVFPTTGMTQSRLTELMTGHAFDDAVSARSLEHAPVVLEVAGLSRDGCYADVSLTLRRGEVLGITGLLGAGHTELALTLFGLMQAEHGQVRLDGAPVAFRSNVEAIRAGVSYLSEDRLSLGLVQAQPIAGNIVISILDRLLDRLGLLDPRRQRDAVEEWIERLAIKVRRPEDAVATLSGGNQQRVVLGKWLATRPKVLILDSPTVGVDVGARAGIFEIVRELADDGIAILLISDEIPEVYFNADRVLHMRDGRIEGEYLPSHTTLDELERAVHA